MFAVRTLLLLLRLGMIFTVTWKPLQNVKQVPERLRRTKGTNATFYCSFSLVKDKSQIDVQWWREGEEELLNRRDTRNRFEVVNLGTAVFHLLNLSVSDSGRYYCKVRYELQIGNGNGTWLDVSVPPAPLKITSIPLERSSSVFLKLVCKTHGFYPDELQLSWFVNGSEIATGISTDVQPSEQGLFQVSSSMEEKSAVQPGTVYTCQVSHPSLQTPAISNYIFTSPENANHLPWWLYASIGTGAFLLLLPISILILCRCCIFKGREITPVETDVQEMQLMQRPASEGMAYATLDFNNSRKCPDPQRKQKTTQPHAAPRVQARNTEITYATTRFK